MTPIFMIATGIGLMFGIGASVVASIRLSENSVKAARIIMTQAFAVGLLLTGVVCLFLDTQEPAYGLAVEGLPLFASCAVFFALNIAFIGYYQSIEKAAASTAYTLLRGVLFLVPCFLLLPR